MKKSILVLVAVALFATSVVSVKAQGHFSIGASMTYGTFTDEYVREIYSGFPTVRGLIGYTSPKVGIYAFIDYGKATGNPLVETYGDFNIGSAGCEMKMATVGVELRAFIGQSFYLVSEVGSTALEEYLWMDDLSASGTLEGWSYGGGFGFEFPVYGTLKGDVSLRLTDAKVSSPAKEIATGEDAASLGRMFIQLGLKF